MNKQVIISLSLVLSAMLVLIAACKKDVPYVDGNGVHGATGTNGWVYNPTPVVLSPPPGFPQFTIPTNNPETKEGILLGRMLFYDPILSGDSTQKCATCHQQQYAFTNGPSNRFSLGITGHIGTRNAPPLFNLVYSNRYFWDGRAATLEDQVQQPVINPIEMNAQWATVIAKLKASSRYPKLFYEAFGITKDSITPLYTAKALAQFLRTLISANSPFDQTRAGGFAMSDAAIRGIDVFQNGIKVNGHAGGDCFHCHGDPSNSAAGNITFMELSPAGQFRNNGLDSATTPAGFADQGRGKITGAFSDYGKFKIPSLRNLVYTAPYMHDGRFATLEDVVDFYSHGVNNTPFTDPNMQYAYMHGVNLTDQDRSDLLAFLRSLSDSSFVTNPAFSNPF